MTRTLIIQPEAEADTEVARDRYERQRPGLGTTFVSALESHLTLLRFHQRRLPQERKRFVAWLKAWREMRVGEMMGAATT